MHMPKMMLQCAQAGLAVVHACNIAAVLACIVVVVRARLTTIVVHACILAWCVHVLQLQCIRVLAAWHMHVSHLRCMR